MERWNREALYAEVWEQPLTKVATKYGISNVMLAKVCRKLKIPVPGRGYWAKQRFGKPVKRAALPEMKDVPVMYRSERPANGASAQPVKSQPEPTDPEYMQIKEVESRSLVIDPAAERHTLIVTSQRILRQAHADSRGILQPNWECLDIRVSKGALDRAIAIMNAVILGLERMKFNVKIQRERYNTRTQIFGYFVPFAIVEKYREKARREVQAPSWTKWEIEYQPTGKLEFQIGQDRWCRYRFRDGKRRRLEEMLPAILGGLMRDARERVLEAERNRQEEIERRNKEIELQKLRDEIDKEQKKVTQLEGWVTAWVRAREMREFVAALERIWIQQGRDLSPEAERGQRITWMKQQADRLDPLVFEKPQSILDRK